MMSMRGFFVAVLSYSLACAAYELPSFRSELQAQASAEACSILSHAIAFPGVWVELDEGSRYAWTELCGNRRLLPEMWVSKEGSLIASPSLLQASASAGTALDAIAPASKLVGHIVRLAPNPGAFNPDGKSNAAESMLNTAGGARAILNRMTRSSPLGMADFPSIDPTGLGSDAPSQQEPQSGSEPLSTPSSFAEASKAFSRLVSRNPDVRLAEEKRASGLARLDAARI